MPQRESPEILAPAELEDWSKFAFQSYRDGNWEIYTADGDGSNQVRRTNHIASDTYPRLNRGCTHIVFASNRTGNYEIYTMAFNGSGLRQLTSNDADDIRPFWSLDGTRIVFQSYRHGQAEIYVMNIDGSGQTRLTSHSGYDGMPSWSPDGTKLLFVSDRSGGYRIWVMNSDGSGKTQVSYEPYSARPVWSPDGSQIAYDSDGDGDGWQELWLMDADGSNRRQVFEHVGGLYREIWTGSWSPDGQLVTFTDVVWRYYEGEWYIEVGQIGIWHIGGGDRTMISGNTEFRPDWHIADIEAPTSSVYPLPAHWRGTPEVEWGGSDVGVAGIEWYDVQVRDGAGGSWADWQIETTDTLARYSGTPGHTYYFRSRATDDAENVEEWPPGDGDAHITFYNWAVSGTVGDNRGIPVAQATITTTPRGFEVSPTDSNGHYLAYVADSAITYTVEWAKDGYDVLPPTGFSAASDAQVDVALPPPNNVVQNWGFERGGLGPEDWQASGATAPTVTGAVKHTGGYAALVGQAFAFAPRLNVSNSSTDSWEPQVAVDGSGTVHIIWSERQGLSDTTDIYYSQRESDGTWSSPQNISSSPHYSHLSRLAVDGRGAVHVVWGEERVVGDPYQTDIFYARRGSGGVWSSPLSIANNPVDVLVEDMQLVVGPNDTVHVLWQGDGINHIRRESGGTWSSPAKLTDRYYPSVRLAVDGKDAAHAVWGSETDGYYAGQGSDGTWHDPENLPKIPGFMGSYAFWNPHLTVDRDGVVHVIGSRGDIYYVRRETDGTWSGPEHVCYTPGESGWSAPIIPSLAVDRSGTVHVAWMDNTAGYDDVYYSYRGSSNRWSDPERLTNISDYSLRFLQMVVEGDGTIHVVWAEYGYPHTYYYVRRGSDNLWSSPRYLCQGNDAWRPLAVEENRFAHVVCVDGQDEQEIYYVGPALAEQSGDSTLSQVITMPITMPNPTLSFLYQLGGVSAVSNTWFSVHVDNGTAAIPLLSTAVNTDVWTHHWSDLAPWSGETITLSFNAHQAEGYPRTWAYLDEVTVGSAYADLWVGKVKTGATALPGEQVVYNITYGNQGGGAAKEVHITDTLPSELLLMEASPPPVFNTLIWAWEWDIGDMPPESGPFNIIVTTTVAPTATMLSSLTNTVSIGSVSPEIETANNVVQAAVYVGHRVYLPVVMRGL